MSSARVASCALWFFAAALASASCGGDDEPTGASGRAGTAGRGGAGGGASGGRAGSGAGAQGGEAGGSGNEGGSSTGAGRGGQSTGGSSGGSGEAGEGGAPITAGTSGTGQAGEAGASGGEAGAATTRTASTEVTPEAGGSVQLGDATVTVPPGAVTTTTTITIQELGPGSVADLPGGFASAGPLYALLPHGQAFAEPVTVTLSHTGDAPALLLSVLRLDDEDDTTWESVPDATFDATTLTLSTTHFSVLTPVEAIPQTMHTVPGEVSVGHLALANGTLFYAVAHPSSTYTVEVGSVTTALDVSPVVPLITVASDFLGPIGTLAANDTTVFFTRYDNLYSVPAAGGAVTDLGLFGRPSTGSGNGVVRIIDDGTNLFYSHLTSSASLTGIDAIGYDGTPLAKLGGDGSIVGPGPIVFDGTDLLFASYYGVKRVPKTLASASVTDILSNTELEANAVIVGLALDEGFVYVLTNKTSPPTTSLYRKPRGGGPLEPVLTPTTTQGLGSGLVLVDGALYFTLQPPAVGQSSPGQTRLVGIDATASNGTELSLADANPYGVLTDGAYLYYGNRQNLVRMRLRPAPP